MLLVSFFERGNFFWKKKVSPLKLSPSKKPIKRLLKVISCKRVLRGRVYTRGEGAAFWRKQKCPFPPQEINEHYILF